MPELAKYPPVVRYLFVDDYDNIWSVVGEWNLDIAVSSLVNATLDIFNKNGILLYTFQTNYFGYGSFVKNNRLFSAPAENKKSIEIYEIMLPLPEYNKTYLKK